MKLKTHKGIKKVLNVRPGGTISIGCAGSRHNTGKKNRDANRKNRKGSLLSASDKKRFKTVKYN
ncbi:MAG: 50S ribosomal protein L35 [Bacilli bacterium]|nr:50S ribosomal protein L35 [Bacilli bacterium]